MLVRAGLNIASVILVKVTELIVNIDWSINFFADFKRQGANTCVFTLNVILQFDLLDFVRHHVHDYTKSQEYYSKNDENSQCAEVGGDWSPRRQHLLLELALLEPVDTLGDAVSFFFGNLHNIKLI